MSRSQTPAAIEARVATAGSPVGRGERIVVIAILVVAAVIRLAYLAEIRGDPELVVPPVDGAFILYWAHGLATGDWTLPPDALGRDPLIRTTAYQRPPGYPYVLAAMLVVTGGEPVAVRALQMLAGVITIGFAWWLARRLFGPAIALTWAALLATYWALPYFEAGIDDAWLVIALSVVMMLVLRSLVLRPRLAAAVAAGGTLAAIALVRPNALMITPLLLAWWVWVARRRGLDRRTATAIVGAAALAGAMVLAPATIRNLRVAGVLVPVSANGGITMWVGTNPTAQGFSTSDVAGLGTFTSPWQMGALVDRLSLEVGRELDFPAASNLLGRRALAWATQHPGAAALLTLSKAALFWGPCEIAHNRAPAADRAASPLLRRLPLPFALALAGGLLGVAIALGQHRIGNQPLAHGTLEVAVAMVLFATGWFASLLPFFIASLYRMPVIPYLLLGCAVTVVHIVRLAAARRRSSAATWAAAAALGWALAAVPWIPVDPGVSKRHVIRGIAWTQLGQPARAEHELQQAVAVAPDSWPARNALGAMLFNAGRIAEAEPHLLAAVSLQPGATTARLNLALCYAARGAWPQAAESFATVVADEPRNADAWADLGIAREQLGQRSDAAAAYARALAVDPYHASAANNLAWLLATAPDPSLRDGFRAVTIGERLAARTPTAAVLDTLAAAYAEAGRFADAITTAERALRTASADPALAAPIAARLELYRHSQPFVDLPALH